LRERLAGLGITDAFRLKTAQAIQTLLDRLNMAEGAAVVSALASAEVATSEAAMGTVLEKANELSATLNAFNWEILDAVTRLTDDRQAAAAEVKRLVCEALTADEQAAPLAPALKEAQSKAVRLLTQPLSPPPPPSLPPLIKEKKDERDKVRHGERAGLSVTQARLQLDQLEQEARAGHKVTVNLSWQIAEGGGES
jgi:hypothetical protein